MGRLRWMVPSRRRVLVGVGVVVVVVGALAALLMPLRGRIDGAVLGLVFLLPTVLGAAIGGFVAAVAGVSAGFVGYNFLFTQPYYTLLVGELEDVVGLSVYVVVGVVITLTVIREQRAARAAARREDEARTLFMLSRSLLLEHELEAVLDSVIGNVRSLFGVETVAVLLPEGGGLEVAAVDGEEIAASRLRASWDQATDAGGVGDPDAEAVPLVAGDRRVGVLVVAGSVDGIPGRLLTAFANQAAGAIERARLAQESMRVEVLEEVDRLRSALMGAVSHDLRSPLSSIAAAVSDLRDPEVDFDAEDTDTLLATIEEETRRLDRLVSNVLDVSRIEGDALSVRPEAVEIDDLVDEATRSRHLGACGRQVGVELPDDLPPVAVDPTLIVQVLVNLLDNAVRYSPPDIPPCVVATVGEGCVEVRVQDAGPGIPAEDRPGVFDLSYRVHDNGTPPDGTGLGLAICKGYVEAHETSIWIEDTPGGGTTVAFRLPSASARARLAPMEPS